MNRRKFLLTSFAATACPAGVRQAFAYNAKPIIRLGMASYTFHKFDMAHVIDFIHQLKCPYLNVKDVHLPMAPLSDVPHLAQAVSRSWNSAYGRGCYLFQGGQR